MQKREKRHCAVPLSRRTHARIKKVLSFAISGGPTLSAVFLVFFLVDEGREAHLGTLIFPHT